MGGNPEDLKTLNDMKFGVAMQHVQKKLTDYPKLFDNRAAWMRNAIAHEFLSYDLSTDKITLRDITNNRVTFTANELIELAEDMYLLAAVTIARVGQLYLFREIFRDRGLGDILLDHLPALANEKDPAKITAIEADLQRVIEKRFRGT